MSKQEIMSTKVTYIAVKIQRRSFKNTQNQMLWSGRQQLDFIIHSSYSPQQTVTALERRTGSSVQTDHPRTRCSLSGGKC